MKSAKKDLNSKFEENYDSIPNIKVGVASDIRSQKSEICLSDH